MVLARPKSHILALQSEVIRILDDFKSLCITFASWRKAIEHNVWYIMLTKYFSLKSILNFSSWSRSDSKNSITRHISFRLTPLLFCFRSSCSRLLPPKLQFSFVSPDLVPPYDEGRLVTYRSCGQGEVMMSINSVINNPLPISPLPPTFYTSSELRLLSFLNSEISLRILMASYSVSVWFTMIFIATSLPVCLH